MSSLVSNMFPVLTCARLGLNRVLISQTDRLSKINKTTNKQIAKKKKKNSLNLCSEPVFIDRDFTALLQPLG